MSNMVTRNRVSNAFLAMKNIGISENKVKPVLKKLVKLYDKNWELIEAENYRALADAIFESEETEVGPPPQKIQSSEAAEHSQNIVNYEEGDEMEDEAQERPLKRLRHRDRNGQTSSKHMSDTGVTRTPLISPKEEPNELPETAAENIGVKSQPATCQSLGKNKGKQPVNPESLIVNKRVDSVQLTGVSKSQQNIPSSSEPRSLVHPMRLRERGKGSTSSQTPPKVRRPATENSSRDTRLKELKVEPGIVLSPEKKTSACPVLTKPKDEPITDDMPLPEAPIAVIPPEPLNGGDSNGDGAIREDSGELTSDYANQLETADGTSSLDESRNNGKLAMLSANATDCNGIDYGSQPNKKTAGDENGPGTSEQEICAEQANKNPVAVQQPHVTPEMIRSDVVDIAKGQEKVVITLVNDVNNESPPSFQYIPKNAIFQDAYVNVSLARIGDNNCCSTCVGDCLSLETPCVCSYESGGEFAYTVDGLVKEELLKESISMNRDPKKHCQFFCKECPLERSKNEDTVEPCKGHLVRKFIKECWLKCGCNRLCGNRVVQRGISRKLQVFMTPEGKGWGLRTLEDLPKGAFVCEYVGEVLTNAELFDRVLRKPKGEKHSYPVFLDADWCAEGVLKDEDALCLDATHYGNVARFINHRCYDSTMVEIPVEVETPDHHYYHLAFFTTRKVKAMEELTWDYGIDFDDLDHPIKAFSCQCGSKYCRNIKRSRSRSARR